MANNTIDSVTGITVPTVGAEPGPTYATDISEALLALAHLTHTGAANLDGYQIPAAGLDIDDDVSFQSNNLLGLRSARFDNQAETLAGVGDVNCIYFKDGDCYINNGSGIPVAVTDNGLLNVITTNNYPTLELSVNHTINAIDADVVFNYDTAGSVRILTLPLASTVQAGRFYFIKDKAGSCGSNQLTINPSGSDSIDGAASSSIGLAFGAMLVMSDGVDNYQVYSFSRPDTVFGTSVSISSTTSISLSGALLFPAKAVTTSPYTVDTTTKDYYILVDTTSGARIVNLPTATTGRVLIIKDVAIAGTNNITLVRAGGSGNIEGVAASYVMDADLQGVTLAAYSGDWFIVATA